jgi:hypothetical protein
LLGALAGVQKTTIRTFTVEGEEKNEGLHPHIRWTKTPDFIHVYRGILPMNGGFLPHCCTLSRTSHPSQKSLSKRSVNTSTSKGSLFFAPKLREPQHLSTKGTINETQVVSKSA